MSRHRAVRNLDLDEELAEDDYYDEDPYGMYKFSLCRADKRSRGSFQSHPPQQTTFRPRTTMR